MWWRPVLRASDLGFDRLEIFTQIPVERVHSVLIDGEEISDRFPPEIEDDRLIVSFDRLVGPHDNEKRIEVVFDAKVLRFGADFRSWVYDSAEPELKQQVAPGNATFRFSGDVVSVRTAYGRRSHQQRTGHASDLYAQRRPASTTTSRFYMNWRDLESLRQIRLRIYDLSGRLVRQIATNTGSGSFAQTWNGRDEEGALVPPGMYLYQLDWDTDKGREVANGVVGGGGIRCSIMKPKLYIENSIVSYLTAEPSVNIITAARQALTRQWWNEKRFDYQLYISEFVISEARDRRSSDGNPTSRGTRRYCRNRTE